MTETFPWVDKLPVERGHKPGPTQTQEDPNSISGHHISYGVVGCGIVDSRDLGGEQIDLRASKGNQRDRRHFVLMAKSNTPESGPRFTYIYEAMRGGQRASMNRS